MIYELALISVMIGAGYWGWFFLRQRPHGTSTFGAMQLAAAVLSALGLIGRRLEVAWLGVPGAIGVGAGLCLLVLGPLARVLARRLVAAERMKLATRLLDIAELLAPGSGVSEEKAVVRAMSDIRDGRIEQTLQALSAARDRAPAETRLAIDERIAMLYLTANRWREAIGHAEANLFGAAPPQDAEGSLRRALGVAPPLWVDLLGAYGRTGDLDQAARMLARLEEICAGRGDAALWVHRGRMMFLALAGRPEAVRALVAPRRSRHMTPAARAYWLAVAHERAGDRAAAAAVYRKARGRSRGRARDLIDQALAGLADATPIELTGLAGEVVARIEAAPPPPPVRIAQQRRAHATRILTAVVLAVPAVTAIALGESSDTGVLVRAGALVRGLVEAGEWWRVISCLFIHVGLLHLVFNAFGLLVIGRIAEDLLGAMRVIAIFAIAGLAGAAASYFASSAGLSAGASGAVFGLLGAVFVEITWHRQRYRTAWKQGLWGALAVVTVGQLAYGFTTPVIDQWAHGAGLLSGLVLGVALSPSARWARAGTVLARAITAGFGVAVVVAAVLVAQTSLTDSVASGPVVRRVVDGVAVQVPAGWGTSEADHQVFQPDGLVTVTVARQARTSPSQQVAMWLAEEGRHAKDELGELRPARSLIALPAGWEGGELAAAPEDAMGYTQRVRLIVCARAFGDQMIFVAIAVPETIARETSGFLSQLLAVIGPA